MLKNKVSEVMELKNKHVLHLQSCANLVTVQIIDKVGSFIIIIIINFDDIQGFHSILVARSDWFQKFFGFFNNSLEFINCQ